MSASTKTLRETAGDFFHLKRVAKWALEPNGQVNPPSRATDSQEAFKDLLEDLLDVISARKGSQP